MRDNHQGYTEILDTYERDGFYFGVVRVMVSVESAAFEFGVDGRSYSALKGILQTRPFDQMAGAPYRYFFTGGHSKKSSEADLITISIRIEEGRNAKNFSFECPVSLAQNLKWFHSLTDLTQAAALKRLVR
jgi:hypothetical protein